MKLETVTDVTIRCIAVAEETSYFWALVALDAIAAIVVGGVIGLAVPH